MSSCLWVTFTYELKEAGGKEPQFHEWLDNHTQGLYHAFINNDALWMIYGLLNQEESLQDGAP